MCSQINNARRKTYKDDFTRKKSWKWPKWLQPNKNQFKNEWEDGIKTVGDKQMIRSFSRDEA